MKRIFLNILKRNYKEQYGYLIYLGGNKLAYLKQCYPTVYYECLFKRLNVFFNYKG